MEKMNQKSKSESKDTQSPISDQSSKQASKPGHLLEVWDGHCVRMRLISLSVVMIARMIGNEGWMVCKGWQVGYAFRDPYHEDVA